LIDVAKGQPTLPRILRAQTSIKKILESDGMADISGWFAGVFAIYSNPQWSDLHTARENEIRREVLEAALARGQGGEGNEDDMQVDSQRTSQDLDPSTSSLKRAANGGGLFFIPKCKDAEKPILSQMGLPQI
jgi:hypothetical protein